MSGGQSCAHCSKAGAGCLTIFWSYVYMLSMTPQHWWCVPAIVLVQRHVASKQQLGRVCCCRLQAFECGVMQM
jgi:hypothetical protein